MGRLALPANSYQGMVQLANGALRPYGVVVQGNLLYIPTNQDVQIVDIAAAMDEDPNTTIGASPTRYTVPTGGSHAIDVHGSYLVVSAYYSLQVWDVSSPASPVLLSSAPYSNNGGACFIYGLLTDIQSGLSVHGTRAYVTGPSSTNIFELE